MGTTIASSRILYSTELLLSEYREYPYREPSMRDQ